MRYLMIVLLLTGLLGMLYAQEASAQFMAADQSLMVMPTAYTMPKGAHTFTNYEIVIIQYAYGLTPYTHLSAGMLFPIVSEAFDTFTAGIKQNYFRQDIVQSALWVSYNPKVKGGMFGNVISVGNEKISGHGAAVWLYDFEGVSSAYGIMLGGIYSASQRIALISEFLTVSEFMDEDPNGIITFGVRFKGQKMSWDIGGFRTTADMGGVFMLPLLKATVQF